MNDQQQPVTKADLAQLKTDLLEAVRATLDGRLDAFEDRLKAYTRDVARDTETRILSAIHGYTERLDHRFRRLESAEAHNAERLASVEADARWASLELRVLELEKRVFGKQ